MKKFLILFFVMFVFAGCDDRKEDTLILNETLYEDAILDAMIAEENEICDSLIVIAERNPYLEWKEIEDVAYVKVATFTAYPESFQDSIVTNSWGELWVFIPNQVKETLAQTVASEKALRMKQLLGLPPTNTGAMVAELWINPNDLFRPSPDNEITDSVSELYLPETVSSDYEIWFNETIYNSYYGGETNYPWTRLGYTYDWNRYTSEIGVSEFCIHENSTIYVEEVYPVESY